MTKQTTRRYSEEARSSRGVHAEVLRSRLMYAVSLGFLVACGQTDKAGTDVSSDTNTSSAGPSGASSSASSSTSVSSGSATSTNSTGSVGSSSSSSGTSSHTTGSNSTASGDVGSTGGSSSVDTSGGDSSSVTSGDSETTATSEGDSATPDSGSGADAGGGVEDDGSMTFFVTSTGVPEGGNLGGLDGADAFCTQLAAAVSESLGNKVWRAYLSTSTVNARDRIGTGPWRNAEGVVVANSVDELHAQEPGEALDDTWPPTDLAVALTEDGEQVPNMIHDILTGSLPDGTVDEGRHCNDWTSSESTDEASVGHSNRDGGGRPPYFNATHQVGCAPSATNYQEGTVTAGGGQGSIYCFALLGE